MRELSTEQIALVSGGGKKTGGKPVGTKGGGQTTTAVDKKAEVYFALEATLGIGAAISCGPDGCDWSPRMGAAVGVYVGTGETGEGMVDGVHDDWYVGGRPGVSGNDDGVSVGGSVGASSPIGDRASETPWY